MATSQTIIAEAFPPKKAGAGMAVFGASIACGPALGPLLGGYLTDTYSWHWIFIINVPLGIIATLFSWLYIADQKERHRKNRLDWIGIALLAVGIGSLQFVLEEGNVYDWFQSKTIITFSILAATGIIFFIIWELRTPNPAVKLSLFKIPNIALGAILNFVIGAVLLGVMYSYPLYAQISLGWTSTLTGLSLTPGAVMTAVTISVVQIASRKGVSQKSLVFIGFAITVIFCFCMYFQSPDSNWDSLFMPMILRGLGMGFIMLPVIVISIQGLKGYDLEQGTGISNMTR
jgi:DHA2 family multidrug resistance protein